MATRILHIDTSGPVGLVMLAIDGRPVSHKSSDAERDHAGKVNILVAEVLATAGCRLADLDAIAVCNGPGSYTGLRIGLATAKGYCYALDKRLILHNRLVLMLQEIAANEEHSTGNILAIIPARSGEYYMAAVGNYQSPAKHITAQGLLEETRGQQGFRVIGQYGNDLSAMPIERYQEHSVLNIEIWAAETYKSFQANQFADVAYAEPEYLKAAYIAAPRVDR